MATNLRLRKEAEEALRVESERTGRTQQELIRRAVDTALGLNPEGLAPSAADVERRQELRRRGITPPRVPYREATTLIQLPAGTASTDVIDREDRVP